MRLTTACCKRGCSGKQPYLLFITFGARRQDTAFNSPPDNKPKNVRCNHNETTAQQSTETFGDTE